MTGAKWELRSRTELAPIPNEKDSFDVTASGKAEASSALPARTNVPSTSNEAARCELIMNGEVVSHHELFAMDLVASNARQIGRAHV
jgi:hypothetical protein